MFDDFMVKVPRNPRAVGQSGRSRSRVVLGVSARDAVTSYSLFLAHPIVLENSDVNYSFLFRDGCNDFCCFYD